MNRRAFLTGLIAAPVVVRSGVLMPLRGIVMPALIEPHWYWVGTPGDPFLDRGYVTKFAEGMAALRPEKIIREGVIGDWVGS